MAPDWFLLYMYTHIHVVENTCILHVTVNSPCTSKEIMINFPRLKTLLFSCAKNKALLSWVSFY